AAIRGDAKKVNTFQVYMRLLQNGFDPRFGLASFDEQKDALHPCKMTHDFRKRPRDWGEFSGPIGKFMRPAEECSFVRLPLRRHAVTKRVGRSRRRFLLHSPSQRLRMG